MFALWTVIVCTCMYVPLCMYLYYLKGVIEKQSTGLPAINNEIKTVHV